MKKLLLVLLGVVIGFTVVFVLLRTAVKAPTGEGTPAPTASNAAELNITVTSPVAGQKVTLPFTVKGTERTFEQSVAWQVRTPAGTVIGFGNTTGHASDVGIFGPYSFTVTSLPQKGNLELWVFEYSAKDGSIINLVKTPIVVQ